jgi:hypothetical protein
MKALILMLLNTAKNTYHPILYLESPFAGGQDNQPEGSTRFKSKMHHTGGFGSLEEAQTNVPSLEARVKEHMPMYSDVSIHIDEVIEWDGKGIPAESMMWVEPA